MSTAQSRFSDYVTSGAFNMSLTRNQISELSFAIDGAIGLARPETLERKGLIELVEREDGEPGSHEWRLTEAGCLVLNLLHVAGLTNSGGNPLVQENASLRVALNEARQASKIAQSRARSAAAKYDWLAHKALNFLRNNSGKKLRFPIVLKDHHPHTCIHCLKDFEIPVGFSELETCLPEGVTD